MGDEQCVVSAEWCQRQVRGGRAKGWRHHTTPHGMSTSRTDPSRYRARKTSSVRRRAKASHQTLSPHVALQSSALSSDSAVATSHDRPAAAHETVHRTSQRHETVHRTSQSHQNSTRVVDYVVVACPSCEFQDLPAVAKFCMMCGIR